jgi:ribosomal protein S18 acetylase RimI-like enzyme
VRLSMFSWDGFVKNGGLFVNLVGGALAGGIVLTTPDSLPKWMISSATLLFLSMGLAFTRVWKTAREERETSGLWDQLGEVPRRGSGMEQVKDAVFEIPYLFSMVFLPASVVSLQTFAGCLLLFYVADNYYNFALVRGIADARGAGSGAESQAEALRRRSRRAAGRVFRAVTRGRLEPALALVGAAVETMLSIPSPRPRSLDRAVLVHYFRRRAELDRIAIWLLALCLGLALFGSREWAQVGGTAIVVTILAMELLVEPFRALGLHYEAAEPDEPDPASGGGAPGGILLWTAPRGAALDDESIATLRRIHDDAFPPGERQYDVRFMLDNAGRHGFQLLLLTEPGGPTSAHRVAGYVFLQARPELEIAYLWYLAVDRQRRGNGLGSAMVSLALEEVRDRWPAVRAVFLEAGERPRRFYRGMGFWWLRGLDYRIPVEGDSTSSLTYDPMFAPLCGPADEMDDRFVGRAVLEMARDNFRFREHDQRWQDLRASVSRMRRVSPADLDEAWR